MRTPESPQKRSERHTTSLKDLKQGICPTNADLIACKMTPDMLTEEVRAAIGRHIPTCLDCTQTSLNIDAWTPEQEARTIKRAKTTPLKDLHALVQKAIEEGDMTTVKVVAERCKDRIQQVRNPSAYVEIVKFMTKNTFLRDKMK